MVALGSQVWHFAVALSFLSGSAPVVTTVKDSGDQRVRAVPIITRLSKSVHQHKKPLVVDTKRLEKAAPLHGIVNSMGSMTVVEALSAVKSAESKDVATAVNNLLNAIRNALPYRCVKTFAYPGNKEDVPFCSLLCLPNGSIGYYVTYGRYARVINGETVTELATNSVLSGGTCFLPLATMLDEKRLVVVRHLGKMAERDQQMCLFNAQSGCEEKVFKDEFVVLISSSYFGDDSYLSTHWSRRLERICALTVCPNGSLITGSPLGNIKVWDTKKSYVCTKTFDPYVEIAYSSSLIEREPTEELLCSLAALSNTDVVYGLYDGTVKTLHLEDGKREALGEHHAKAVTAVVAIDDKMFASGSADGIIKIWRLDKQNRFVCTQTLQEHTTGIISLAVNINYELFSLSEDGEIRVWRR